MFQSKLEAGEALNLQAEIKRAEENPAWNLGRLRQKPDDLFDTVHATNTIPASEKPSATSIFLKRKRALA